MNLRSQVKAANSSGSFWTNLRSGSISRRSRRLSPALQHSSLHLLPAAGPPSSRSLKRKHCTADDSSPPMVQVKRKRNEDGLILPPPPPSSSSEVVDSDVHGSTMMEDGIRSEKGSDSNDAVLEEANKSGSSVSEVSDTENQIPEEERNCCLNRSPSYSSFSTDDDEVEIIDDEVAEDVVESAEEEQNKELPSISVIQIRAEEGENMAEGISESERTNAAAEEYNKELPPLNLTTETQLDIAMEKGGYSRMESEKAEVSVRDFAPEIIKGGGGEGGWTWTFRRTEIVAGSRRSVELSEGKVPIVCLYDSLSLPDY
ncbi:hypothetical protein LINPERHAP1_LOCUS28099 [Linum perenne]